jgi:copper(I)-binding protein
MFLDLKAPPVEGKPFKGTLVFEKAGKVDVEFAVEGMGEKSAGSHMKMDHMNMDHMNMDMKH